ncbi:MAG: hypothetical protein ABIQ70_00975 [Dokdonella sp.]
MSRLVTFATVTGTAIGGEGEFPREHAASEKADHTATWKTPGRDRS